jgi:hypothetical protein
VLCKRMRDSPPFPSPPSYVVEVIVPNGSSKTPL